jgi:hypothetical protein
MWNQRSKLSQETHRTCSISNCWWELPYKYMFIDTSDIFITTKKNFLMCLHIVVTVWQYSSFTYCDWNPDLIFWLVSKCEVSNRTIIFRELILYLIWPQDWYFIQNDSISTYSLPNMCIYNLSYYSLCLY